MSFSLVVQSEAIFDIQQAFEWYESRKTGLGFDFIEEVESVYEKITNHPFHYVAVNERFRRIKINRFPYILVYEIEDTAIVVNSVRHMSRKPKY
jgi:hypothetical protein